MLTHDVRIGFVELHDREEDRYPDFGEEWLGIILLEDAGDSEFARALHVPVDVLDHRRHHTVEVGLHRSTPDIAGIELSQGRLVGRRVALPSTGHVGD